MKPQTLERPATGLAIPEPVEPLERALFTLIGPAAPPGSDFPTLPGVTLDMHSPRDATFLGTALEERGVTSGDIRKVWSPDRHQDQLQEGAEVAAEADTFASPVLYAIELAAWLVRKIKPRDRSRADRLYSRALGALEDAMLYARAALAPSAAAVAHSGDEAVTGGELAYTGSLVVQVTREPGDTQIYSGVSKCWWNARKHHLYLQVEGRDDVVAVDRANRNFRVARVLQGGAEVAVVRPLD